MRPSQRLLRLLLGWSLLGLTPLAWQPLLAVWLLAGAALALTALLDARAGSGGWATLRAERDPVPPLAVGVWTTVRLQLSNPHPAAQRLAVFDHHPQPADSAGLPAEAVIPGTSRLTLDYRLRPLSRGRQQFGPVQVLAPSPLGLWQHDLALGRVQSVKVLPNFAALTGYALLARDRRLNLLGIHQQRRRGAGQDFLQLREYREDDSLRRIDWKATARRRKLIAKEYQDERDQRLVFMLDCGRRLRAVDDRLSHFDHALNALLLLAYVALRQGDAVGLQCFAGSERWLATAKGPGVLRRLLETVYDLQPTLHSADYAAAGAALLNRQRKRALVVVLTNLRDEDSDQLLPMLGLLRRRHLVLLASLRETALDRALRVPVGDLDQARLYAAVCDYLDARRLNRERLTAAGGQLLDVTPKTLPAALINRYLAIKRGGLL